MDIENKLKTIGFWLKVGLVNHCVALTAVALGCAYSGFTCQGEAMKDALSLYAFTVFTPQIALEVILLMALFLVSSSIAELRKNTLSIMLFIGTLSMLALFAIWQ